MVAYQNNLSTTTGINFVDRNSLINDVLKSMYHEGFIPSDAKKQLELCTNEELEEMRKEYNSEKQTSRTL